MIVWSNHVFQTFYVMEKDSIIIANESNAAGKKTIYCCAHTARPAHAGRTRWPLPCRLVTANIDQFRKIFWNRQVGEKSVSILSSPNSRNMTTMFISLRI